MSPEGIRRVIAYIRVSTEEQGESGAGLAAQEKAIRLMARLRGWEVVRVARDVASGKSINGRHALKGALADLKAHKADALVVAKLDRLSRSVADFGKVLEDARRQKWHLVLLDLLLDTSAPMGEAMATMAVTMAQFERRMIGLRTREALAVKREQGVRLGRERVITPDVERRIRRLRSSNLSYRKLAEKLNAEGRCVPPGGGVWGWTTIRRVVERSAVRA